VRDGDGPAVKVCCIASEEEARIAVEAGATALGLVSAMPSGPGVIPEALIARIAAAAPPGVETFLLTSERRAAAIAAQQRRVGVTTIQLCDALEPGETARLRAALPTVRLVQVIHVMGPESVAEARAAADGVDALLLDSGNPDLAVKELGGTGRTHDWRVSRAIVAASARPVYLAGGLTPENVAGAVAAVRPFGVDVCTGVRAAGRLDPRRLAAFVRAAREGWKEAA
jgi:phosphoribosylanthranilate isomerase